MNIFIHELRAYRKTTIIWTCSMAAVVIIFLSMFPSFAKDAEEFRKLLENYPPEVTKALGITMDSLFSLLGFYSYVFLYITLCGSIEAMNLGVGILSKEIREKTADFLLTKPVTRQQIITAKLSAALTSIVITDVIYFIIAFIMAKAVSDKPFDFKIFFMISITLFFIQLMFLVLGILVSVLASKIRAVLPVSLSTVLGLFVLGMLGSIIGEKAIRYITPFKYYDTAYIMRNSSYEMTFVVVEIIFVIVSVAISYLVYSKKDIHAV